MRPHRQHGVGVYFIYYLLTAAIAELVHDSVQLYMDFHQCPVMTITGNKSNSAEIKSQ